VTSIKVIQAKEVDQLTKDELVGGDIILVVPEDFTRSN
jgi:hypothetical protein